MSQQSSELHGVVVTFGQTRATDHHGSVPLVVLLHLVAAGLLAASFLNSPSPSPVSVIAGVGWLVTVALSIRTLRRRS